MLIFNEIFDAMKTFMPMSVGVCYTYGSYKKDLRWRIGTFSIKGKIIPPEGVEIPTDNKGGIKIACYPEDYEVCVIISILLLDEEVHSYYKSLIGEKIIRLYQNEIGIVADTSSGVTIIFPYSELNWYN